MILNSQLVSEYDIQLSVSSEVRKAKFIKAHVKSDSLFTTHTSHVFQEKWETKIMQLNEPGCQESEKRSSCYTTKQTDK